RDGRWWPWPGRVGSRTAWWLTPPSPPTGRRRSIPSTSVLRWRTGCSPFSIRPTRSRRSAARSSACWTCASRQLGDDRVEADALVRRAAAWDLVAPAVMQGDHLPAVVEDRAAGTATLGGRAVVRIPLPCPDNQRVVQGEPKFGLPEWVTDDVGAHL